MKKIVLPILLAATVAACGGGGGGSSASIIPDPPLPPVVQPDPEPAPPIMQPNPEPTPPVVEEPIIIEPTPPTTGEPEAPVTEQPPISDIIIEFDPEPEPEEPVVEGPSPEDVAAQEFYDRQYGRFINAGATGYEARQIAATLTAHQRGIDGSGIQIRVLDDFSSFSTLSPRATPAYTHGGYVSDVIQDHAPGATIRQTDVLGRNAKGKTPWNGINYDGDNVVNISAGIDTAGKEFRKVLEILYPGQPITADIAKDFLDYAYGEVLPENNALFVVSSGNNGMSCETYLEGCNAWAVKLHDDGAVVIAAGALNDSGTDLEFYSTRAGITQNYFLSSHVDDEQLGAENNRRNEGTSYSAPVISATAALVMHKFDNTDPTDTRDILFETADDLGDPGVDAVYGHGRLNIGRALSPVGNLR